MGKRRLKPLWAHMLMPVLLMTLLLVVLLTVLISQTYSEMSVSQESEKNTASFVAIADQLGKTVSASIDDAQVIAVDSRVTGYVRHQFETDAKLIRARMECRDYLRSEINRHSAIYGLMFMRPDGSMFGALPNSNLFKDGPDALTLPEHWIDRITSLPSGQTVWIGPLTGSELYGYESDKLPDSVMAAAWKFVSVEAGECYALMLMDDAVFKDMFSLLDDGNSALHLFTADGAEFFRQGGDSGLDPQTLVSEQSNGRVFKNDQNQSWCVFTMPLDVSGWTLAREVPMAEYERIIRRIQLCVWMIAGFIFAGGVVVYLFLLRRFMRGVNTLRSAIACLGQGDIAPVAGARFQSREFAIMGRELDKASVALKEQMDTIRRMERERLELEMKDLQTIITPHMILNSITAIRWQASFMGAEVVSDMLIELGEVLRPVVRELRVQWPIQKELEHVGHYSRLMNLRYANNFKMEYHVQEALKEELIPQFTLQPLIENAAQHGGHPKDGLLVTVRVWEDAEWVYLTVANNGNTISSEKAREIRETLRTGKRTHRVGLLNIHNRLAICKGADSAVDIDALPEGGTVVTLRWRKNGPSTNAVLQEGLAFDDRG